MKRFLLGLFALTLLLILWSSMDLYVPRPLFTSVPKTACNRTIYIVDHGYHTGIILPSDSSSFTSGDRLPFTPTADWYEFGWGDRDFYQDPKPSVAVTLSALLLPTQTTLHVCAINMDPVRWAGSSRICKLEINEQQYEAVCAHVLDTFTPSDTTEGFSYIGKGIYGNSAFYEANFRYHILRNCNAWTAKGIRKMGFPTTIWSPTPRGVFHFLPDYSNCTVR